MLSNKSFSSPANRFFVAAFFAALAFLVYLPTLWHGFVNYDDPEYLYENPDLKDFGFRFVIWTFSNVVHGNWHPLTVISYSIDHTLWGLDPFGYHLANIIIHGLNTFLVCLLSYRLLGFTGWGNREKALGAALTSLLFGLHPLHVESVAWVSERKDVLSGLFFISGIIYYLKYVETGKASPYIATLAFYALAFLSKPMAITLPVVFLILDLYPLKRINSGLKVFAEKVPFFMLTALSAYLTLWAQRSAIASTEVLPIVSRFFSATWAYMFYLYKMIFPFYLAPLYIHPVNFEIWSFKYAGAFAAFALMTFSLLLIWKRQKVFAAAWLYYVITLIPVIGLVQAGLQAAADRYTYLPSLGPFMLIGLGAGWLSKKKAGLPIVIVIAIFLSIALSALTIRQSTIWRDSVSLWTHEISLLEPPSKEDLIDDRAYVSLMTTPYYNRGMAFMDTGKNDLAIKDFTKALELNPEYANALINRGVLYGTAGDYGLALQDFNSAIALDPSDPSGYNNRAIVYDMIGEKEKAEKDLATARRLGAL